jgi:hypothetical protein
MLRTVVKRKNVGTPPSTMVRYPGMKVFRSKTYSTQVQQRKDMMQTREREKGKCTMLVTCDKQKKPLASVNVVTTIQPTNATSP